MTNTEDDGATKRKDALKTIGFDHSQARRLTSIEEWLDFFTCRVVMFLFSFFVEVGLLNCISCNPVPKRNQELSSRGAFEQRPYFG